MERHGPKTRRTRRPSDPAWAAFLSDKDKEDQAMKELLESSLADSGLCNRTVNSLEDSGILTIEDLAKQERDDLLSIDNVGDKTLAECRQLLDGLGVVHPKWIKPRKKVVKKKPPVKVKRKKKARPKRKAKRKKK